MIETMWIVYGLGGLCFIISSIYKWYEAKELRKQRLKLEIKESQFDSEIWTNNYKKSQMKNLGRYLKKYHSENITSYDIFRYRRLIDSVAVEIFGFKVFDEGES